MTFTLKAESLFTPGLQFPADGTNLKISHVYNDGYCDLLTKLWLKPPDDPRGKLVICPRCGGACRLLVGAPNNRGLCCVGCRSRLTHQEDEREARGGYHKSTRKTVKTQASNDPPKRGKGKPISLPAKPTPKRRRPPARKAA